MPRKPSLGNWFACLKPKRTRAGVEIIGRRVYMPPIRSVTIEHNSLVIVSHFGTLTLTRQDIPNQVLQSRDIPTIEAWVNTWLSEPAQRELTGCYVAVHVYSFDPNLIWTFCCSDNPIVGVWW